MLQALYSLLCTLQLCRQSAAYVFCVRKLLSVSKEYLGPVEASALTGPESLKLSREAR